MLPLDTNLPEPPYFAVIFTSLLKLEADGYEAMAKRMVELSAEQGGFLGVQSVRSPEGFGITVSYWRSLEDISHWKKHAEHEVAQAQGKLRWYDGYEIKICKVERQYRFGEGRGA